MEIQVANAEQQMKEVDYNLGISIFTLKHQNSYFRKNKLIQFIN